MPSNKKKSQRLKPVLDLANLNLENAEAEMGRCRQLLLLEQQKLSGLITYQGEYHEMVHGQTGTPIAATKLQMTQAFLKQLQTAIEQQQSHIQNVERQLQVVTDAWRQRYGNSEAITKVINSAKAEEQAELDRKQQNETDDIAQMRFFSKDTETYRGK